MMNRNILLAGFAIFAMFFGSGNIVFPLSLGRASGHMWAFSMVGFFLTAVFVPFLGLMAIVLLQGSSTRFFNIITVWVETLATKCGIQSTTPRFIASKLSIALQLFIIALIGPFGVIPRCMNVSFGSYKHTDATLPEYLFSALFALSVLLLTIRQEKIMKMISQFLTPIKFSLILLLIILGIYWAPASLSTLPESTGIFSKIGEGVLSGYNTMDLTAAIFFAAIIMKFFSRVDSHPRQVLKDGLWSCLIGASLLTGIYVCFVYLGAKYIHITDHVPDIEVLPIIAQHALGNFAGVVFSLTIVFSCLTTSVALTTCWIDTLNQLNVLITTPYWLKLTLSLLISYVISVFFGFASILSILGPILQYIYPLLIIMAITHIVKERLAL